MKEMMGLTDDDDNRSDSGSEYSTGSDSSAGSDHISNRLVDRSSFEKFWLHLILLLQKSLLMYLRNKKAIIVCTFCPITFCLFLGYFETL